MHERVITVFFLPGQTSNFDVTSVHRAECSAWLTSIR